MNGGKQTQADGQDQQAGWVFKPGDSVAAPTPEPSSRPLAHQPADQQEGAVEWTASEFVAHHKGSSWYVLVFLAAIVVAAIVYFITREIFSAAVILFAAVVFAFAGARKPRVLAYRVDQAGLTIGQKFYPYSQFKSFAIMQDGAFNAVVFMPLKRFLPTVDIYIPPDNAERILEVVAAHLPLEPRNMGMVDAMARRIRF